MSEPSLKSRPRFAPWVPRDGSLHLIVADRDATGAISDLAALAPDGFFTKAQVMLVGERESVDDLLCRRSAMRDARVERCDDPIFLFARLEAVLSEAKMGAQLYLAGSEGFIGQAVRIACDRGLLLEAMQSDRRGSRARRVQCVHCKGVIENVRMQPVVCEHCGLTLFVRDHYSRRLAAYQGVCVDAEEPGVTPAAEELFP